MVFSEKNIKLISAIIEYLYLMLGILAVVVTIGMLLFNREEFAILFWPVLVVMIISGCVYYGLKSRRPWIVSTTMILSSFALIGIIFEQPQNLSGLVVKITGFIFQTFLLFFFSRKEVKNYFNSKETIVV